MKFSNIKVLLNFYSNLNSNEFFDINIKYDNLEKGDTLNYLIGNVEKEIFLLDKNIKLTFHSSNLSIHKLDDNNKECLWSNNVLRIKKSYEELEIEDNSIYCFKFKNINDILIPNIIKSGRTNLSLNNEINNKINNEINNFFLLKNNCKIVNISIENNMYKYLAITNFYSLNFSYYSKEEKFIIEKSINNEPKLSFNSYIEIKKNKNILDKIGYGNITFSDGLKYEGKFNFNNYFLNFYFIEGKATYPDGKLMEGKFIKINNKIYLSNGRITYPNNIIIEGEFDKIYLYFNKYFLLKGKKIFSNNYIEEGLFNDNKLIKGKIIDSKFIYEGIFNPNKKLIKGNICDHNNNLLYTVMENSCLKRKFDISNILDDNDEEMV